MGRFCLTAQAIIFLGKVIRNITDESGQDEAKVLDDTIAALTNVSLQEGHFRGRGVCSPTTLCYRYELWWFGVAFANNTYCSTSPA
jgi:hypothetical protein